MGNVIVLKAKKSLLGGVQKYNQFFYTEDSLDEKSKKISSKIEDIDAKISSNQEEARRKKASKRAREERDYKYFKSITDEKGIEVPDASEMIEEEKPSMVKNFLGRFSKPDEEEDGPEEGYLRLYGEDYNPYDCKLIDISSLLDEKYTPYKVSPTGQALLNRNLNTSKLYVSDNGDLMQVKKVIEVKPELPNNDEVFLLFDTNREYYVIKFACKRSF